MIEDDDNDMPVLRSVIISWVLSEKDMFGIARHLAQALLAVQNGSPQQRSALVILPFHEAVQRRFA